jgi:anti-sigma regulatory factor (Ser/Thr protein kinase)
MREPLSLHLKNDVEEIGRMVQEVAAWCHRLALPEDSEFEIDLVLDELVSNVIRHGLKDSKEHFIDVNVSCDGHDLILQVEDDGVPFNPLDSPTPDINQPIEERGIGGLGIHLVRQIMDQLSYERRGGKNYIFVRKKLIKESS